MPPSVPPSLSLPNTELLFQLPIRILPDSGNSQGPSGPLPPPAGEDARGQGICSSRTPCRDRLPATCESRAPVIGARTVPGRTPAALVRSSRAPEGRPIPITPGPARRTGAVPPIPAGLCRVYLLSYNYLQLGLQWETETGPCWSIPSDRMCTVTKAKDHTTRIVIVCRSQMPISASTCVLSQRALCFIPLILPHRH